MVVFAVAGVIGVNMRFGLNPTLGSLLGIASSIDLPTDTGGANQTPAPAQPIYTTWTPPADMPADAVDKLLFELLQAFATPVSLADVRREKIAAVMARSGSKGAGRMLSREEPTHDR